MLTHLTFSIGRYGDVALIFLHRPLNFTISIKFFDIQTIYQLLFTISRLCHTLVPQTREQIFTWKHRSRVKFWQDFGVVGTPVTDSAGSIRVYAHSTEARSSAPTAVILRGQREGTMFSGLGYRRRLALTNALAIPVVMLALTFHLYVWSSIVSLVLTLQLFLGYQRFLARTHAVVMLRIS